MSAHVDPGRLYDSQHPEALDLAWQLVDPVELAGVLDSAGLDPETEARLHHPRGAPARGAASGGRAAPNACAHSS